MKDVFLPPGVQARLIDRLGTCPRQLPWRAVAQIDALWQTRNQAPEDQLDKLDLEMQDIALQSYGATIAAKLESKWIVAERQYRRQVDEARTKGTPWAAMMAHADQLAECRRALQEAFGLVLTDAEIGAIARRRLKGGKP